MTVPTVDRKTHKQVFSPNAFIDAMRDAKITPIELAAEMHASPEAVAKWMAGLAVPRPGYQKAIADTLDIDVEDLYEDAK